QRARNIHLERDVEGRPRFRERLIERFGLSYGARKTVKNEAALCVFISQTLRDQANDDFIRHKLPGGHELFGGLAQRRARLASRAQHIAGRYLRDTKSLLEHLRLRALTTCRSAQ